MSSDIGSQTQTSEARTSPPPPGRFQCTECQKSFGRIEHLSRHSQSHSQERSHRCPRCRKGFYRLDALMRHEKTHQNPDEQPAGRISRACLACSAARRKCSRGLPCSACVQRSIECIFPTPIVQNSERPEAGRWRNQASGSSIGIERSAESIASSTPWPNNSIHPEENQSNYNYTNLSPGNGEAEVSSIMEHASDQLRDNNQVSNVTVTNTGHGTALIPPGQQLHWNNNAGLLAYQDNWLENDISSINWLPDDWTPAFADAMSINALLQPVQTRGSSSQAQNHQNEFAGTAGAINTNDSQRHWAQANTPGESLGSDQASSTPQSQPSSGRLYVDGDGARLPRVRKAPYQHDETFAQESDLEYQPQNIYWFPDFENLLWAPDVAVHQAAQITQESYDQVLEAFQSTCITSNHFRVYYAPNFPSIDIMSRYVQLYILHFQPIFPFIHPASFKVNSTHWLLILAFGAIGSMYFDGNNTENTQCSLAMLEFLRRALLVSEEDNVTARLDTLLFSQIRLLSCVGSMYSGNERLLRAAKSNHENIVQFCRTEWSQADSAERVVVDTTIGRPGVEDQWKEWHNSESRRRTGYCIWLLDCMWAFHFQIPPLLTLEDATMAIPCQEVLWEAESALDWQQLYTVSTESLSLHAVVQRAYVEKQVQSSTGEFTRILCIHAIFQRTWAVESYLKRPLSVWNPTAERQEIETITKLLPIWLPGIPTYSKWRNSACDVLDCYHWHANAVIGAASGMEHPTVLHLHLARVVLLTPFREIVKLAYLLTEETSSLTKTDEISKLQNYIRRWALEDQFKARLAMIHAGVLFWHVRRYSTDAFYEPSSVFLATLALWAYGTFATKTTTEDSDDESHFPTSMQLDRPADDELVQLFVKRGGAMRAKITGVGNLCSAKGPGRVLVEGKKLLKGLRRWGIGKVLVGTLNSLVEKVLERDGSDTS